MKPNNIFSTRRLLVVLLAMLLYNLSSSNGGVAEAAGSKSSKSKARGGMMARAEEKTIFSTILKSFKDGSVNMTTLAGALHDPNLNKLATTLSKANLTTLASVLQEPNVNLSRLAAAFGDANLDLEKLISAFGDPVFFPPPKKMSAGFMDIIKEWSSKLGDTLNISKDQLPPIDDGRKKNFSNKVGDVKVKKEIIEEQVDDDLSNDNSTFIPQDDDDDFFNVHKSTNKPREHSVGVPPEFEKTILEIPGGEDICDDEPLSGEALSNLHILYIVLGSVVGLSMCIFLMTRFVKSRNQSTDHLEDLN